MEKKRRRQVVEDEGILSNIQIDQIFGSADSLS